ncbi:MAG: glycogen/starch/alpha-glucan family phosphorylase, partial [Eubacterium sp.]
MNGLNDLIYDLSKTMYQKDINELNVNQLHNVVSLAVMRSIADVWKGCSAEKMNCKRAYYLSAEFLVGRAIYNNLFCTGMYDDVKKLLDENGADISCFEEIEDAALGNGGLGRLAACYLDSAASCGIPLDGYGIRYGFGLFKQYFDNGFQSEALDDWKRFGDPWSVRRDEDSVTVHFSDFDAVAVPYDMPIIGWMAKHISTLRLWQAEAENEFDFELFNEQEYSKALELKNSCEDISRVLYPNDSKTDGKILRLRQQYFFSSASLQDMLKRFKLVHGNSFEKLPDYISIQLNDTHPVIAIPELIRLLMLENVSFEDAFELAQRVFNYTNHTIMQEALEKWDTKIIEIISPEIMNIIKKIDGVFNKELESMKITDKKALSQLKIIQGNTVHMAHLACRCSSHINGVAKLHTQILKNDVLKCWYVLYPERFVNITNGITQRRWLGVCNRPLSDLITRLLKSDEWLTDLEKLRELEKYADDKAILDKFICAKNECKKQLADYIYAKDGVRLDSGRIIDVQIKRLHEYKRQLLNI